MYYEQTLLIKSFLFLVYCHYVFIYYVNIIKLLLSTPLKQEIFEISLNFLLVIDDLKTMNIITNRIILLSNSI
jgi:hypothetical protein